MALSLLVFTSVGTAYPTNITVNMNIRSMGPISETDMVFGIDLVFFHRKMTFPLDLVLIIFNFQIEVFNWV